MSLGTIGKRAIVSLFSIIASNSALAIDQSDVNECFVRKQHETGQELTAEQKNQMTSTVLRGWQEHKKLVNDDVFYVRAALVGRMSNVRGDNLYYDFTLPNMLDDISQKYCDGEVGVYVGVFVDEDTVHQAYQNKEDKAGMLAIADLPEEARERFVKVSKVAAAVGKKYNVPIDHVYLVPHNRNAVLVQENKESGQEQVIAHDAIIYGMGNHAPMIVAGGPDSLKEFYNDMRMAFTEGLHYYSKSEYLAKLNGENGEGSSSGSQGKGGEGSQETSAVASLIDPMSP